MEKNNNNFCEIHKKRKKRKKKKKKKKKKKTISTKLPQTQLKWL